MPVVGMVVVTTAILSSAWIPTFATSPKASREEKISGARLAMIKPRQMSMTKSAMSASAPAAILSRVVQVGERNMSVSEMMAAGKCDLRVLSTADKWHGITYAEDKPKVVAALAALTAAGKYPNGLWK